MNWLFWRPRITVKVGDSLTILRSGRRRDIVITGLTNLFVYYKFKDMDLDSVVTHAQLKRSIVDLGTIRTKVEI